MTADDLIAAAAARGLTVTVGPPVRLPPPPPPPPPPQQPAAAPADRTGRHPLVGLAVGRTVTVTIPVVVGPGPNGRDGHWGERSRRVKRERRTVAAALADVTLPDLSRPGSRAAVAVTRLGGRRRDPDNNVASLKGVIDAVATALGVDDGDDRVSWAWGWRAGPAHGVEVTVATGGPLERPFIGAWVAPDGGVGGR